MVEPHHPEVEIRRSARRRRTVSARHENGRIVVLMPAGLSADQERAWVSRMVAKLDTRRSNTAPQARAQLMARAARLSGDYLGGRARPASVTWVDNQQHRWGSCTPAHASIRLSSRLRDMPGYVIDAVLLHELAHLIEPNHSPRFWALLAGFPRLERARGYLEAVGARTGVPITDDDVDEPPMDR